MNYTVFALFALTISMASDVAYSEKYNTMEQSKQETVTLASGCFWCTEAVFNQIKGVIKVTSGYSGGTTRNPTYEEVCDGTTGHAEAVEVVFDPSVISFEQILEIFWYTHDPTSVNRQGADIGEQYRSVIFYHSKQQQDIALQMKKEFNRQNTFNNLVVTEIVPFNTFYPAEKYHQQYYQRNPMRSYCMIVISPKLKKLRETFRLFLKEPEE
jgi:peptide-methionine (S)-S-oxide reductase